MTDREYLTRARGGFLENLNTRVLCWFVPINCCSGRERSGASTLAPIAATIEPASHDDMMRKPQARYAFNPNPSLTEQFSILAA